MGLSKSKQISFNNDWEIIRKDNKYLDRNDLIDELPISEISIESSESKLEQIPKHHTILERELKNLYFQHKNLDPTKYESCGAYTLETWIFLEIKKENISFVKEAHPLLEQIILAREYEMITVHEPKLEQSSEQTQKTLKYIEDRKRLIKLYKKHLQAIDIMLKKNKF